MDHFHRRGTTLYAEEVALAAIAEAVGTPFYVYSRATLERHWRAFDQALSGVEHDVCFAVKANSNLAVLQVLARLGSGFDIVSGGELRRVQAAGGEPERIIFSGVGKTESELAQGLSAGIGCFNVESEAELKTLEALARQHNRIAPIALRVNPDVDAQTHPYISTGLKENKFGIDLGQAEALYRWAAGRPALAIRGVASHIGSQLLSVRPYLDALDRILALVDSLEGAGIRITQLDVGGGLGVRYRDENPVAPAEWAAALVSRIGSRKLKVSVEPGRAIAANAGLLVSRVILMKSSEIKNFAVIDAAMNDLLRPALYEAWMDIVAVEEHPEREPQRLDVVGPVCESGDWIGRDRDLALEAGDLVAVRSAGAYGFSMSSNYNSRPRVAEVLVDQDRFYVVRARETFADLVRGESLLLESGP